MQDQTDYDEYDDQDQDDNPYGPPANGGLVKDLRKQLTAKTRREKELADELAALKTQVRETTVASALTLRGVDPKVAKLIPSDHTTPEQVDAWLGEYGSLFTASTPAADQAPQSPAPSVDEHALGRIASVTAGATPPGTRQEELMSRLRDPALTESDLLALIASGGG